VSIFIFGEVIISGGEYVKDDKKDHPVVFGFWWPTKTGRLCARQVVIIQHVVEHP
jgi:hypothetical protein